MKNTNRIIKISVAALALIVAIAVIFAQFNNTSANPVDEPIEYVEEVENNITVDEAPVLLAVQAPVSEPVEVDPLKEIIKDGLAQVKAVYQKAVSNIEDYDVRHEVDSYFKAAKGAIADINEGDDYEAKINLVVSEFSKAIVKVAGNVIDLSVAAYKELAFELVDAKVEQLVANGISDEVIGAFYEAEFTKISAIDSVESGKLVLVEVQNDVM